MSVKLTDAQLVMMSAAAQREDHCLAAPETMKGAAVSKAGAKLVKLGFAREIHAKPGSPLWRRDETGRSFALKLTAAGLKAIAVDEGPQDAIDPGEASPQLPEAKNGVSLDDAGRCFRGGPVIACQDVAHRVGPSQDRRQRCPSSRRRRSSGRPACPASTAAYKVRRFVWRASTPATVCATL